MKRDKAGAAAVNEEARKKRQAMARRGMRWRHGKQKKDAGRAAGLDERKSGKGQDTDKMRDETAMRRCARSRRGRRRQ